MEDDVNKARAIASEALSQSARGGTVESLISSARRVAALLGHPYMRAWCEMQLQDTTGAINAGEGPRLRAKVQERFPRDIADAISERVLWEYAESRRANALGKDKLYGGALSQLEHIKQMGSDALKVEKPSAEHLAAYNEQVAMLKAIKARAEDYLVKVESKELGPDPLAD